MTRTRDRGSRPSERDDDVERIMRRRSRRSFLTLGLSAAAGLAGWEWLKTRPQEGGVPYPIRRVLEVNERLAEAYFKEARLSPTYPREMAREPRVNGAEGMSAGFDPTAWRLRILRSSEPTLLTLDDIKRLPRAEMTTELKCIEGWSVIVNWAGCRLGDFAAAHNLIRGDGEGAQDIRYVGLETPDRGYYVGLDIRSAMHPQTLLCYEMNGEPLSLDHGAPLRLVTTVKYGIKSIKRIGTIVFTGERPPDFWAERGYDWYAGH